MHIYPIFLRFFFLLFLTIFLSISNIIWKKIQINLHTKNCKIGLYSKNNIFLTMAREFQRWNKITITTSKPLLNAYRQDYCTSRNIGVGKFSHICISPKCAKINPMQNFSYYVFNWKRVFSKKINSAVINHVYITSCEGVDKAPINWATIGLILGLSLSKCLARHPIKMTILCLTESLLAVSGALVR